VDKDFGELVERFRDNWKRVIDAIDKPEALSEAESI